MKRLLLTFLLAACLLAACLLAACSPRSVPATETPSPEPPTSAVVTPSLTAVPPSPTTTSSPIPTATASPTISPTPPREVEGWAVLASQEEYPEGWTDIDTGFIVLYELRALLRYFGWGEDHIYEIRDEVTQEGLAEALAWLAENADQNDVVFVYIEAHGNWFRKVLEWQDFAPELWAAVPGGQRVIVLEACGAGEFTKALKSDPQPHLALASAAEGELGWAGIWEEGLPIIGGVFPHYFIEAFTDPTLDADLDGYISVQEAATYANLEQARYMHEVVYAVPEYLEGMHALNAYPEDDPEYPRVVLDDTTDEPVYLDLEAYTR